MQPFRVEPALPAAAYKTYAVAAPLATHFRPAGCAEAGCRAYANGWTTTVDERIDLGAGQAHYIRSQSGRRYAEHRDEAGLTVFTFEAGQRCFGQHQTPLDRPEIYTVRGGDWRGNPTGDVRRHVSARDWLDDFGEHQQNIADQVERG